MADDQYAAMRAALATLQAAPPPSLPEAPSFLRDVVGRVGIGQGLGMNTGDEIVAGLRSTFGSTPYEQALQEERAAVANARQQSPIASTVAEIGGAVLPALGAMAATGGAAAPAALARLGPMAAGALTGAAQGGVAGFAGGEGGLAPRLDRATGEAVTGGLVGGALGAMAPIVAGATRRFFSSAEEQAADRINRAFRADGTDAGQMGREYAARQAGQGALPETVADIRPRGNVAGTFDAAIQAPSAGRDSLIQRLLTRTDGQGDNLLDNFASLFGTNRGQFHASIEALETAQRSTAEPLYRAAYAHGDVADPLVDSVLLSLPRSIFRNASDLARIEGLSPAALVTMRNGAPAMARVPAMRDLDVVKRSLDDQINSAFRSGNGAMGHALRSQRDLLLARLDEIVPSYGQARAAWAGPARVKDAVKLGQGALREDAPRITDQLSAMSQSEKDGFVTGLIHAVEQRVRAVPDGHDPTKAIRLSPALRERITAAIRGSVQGDADAISAKLFAQMERVQQMTVNTRRATGGSQTADRLAHQQEARYGASMMAAAAGDLLGGGGAITVANLGRMAARKMGDRFEASRMARTNGDVLRLLGATDNAGVQANMATLAAREAQTISPQARALQGARAGLIGSAAARPMTQSRPAPAPQQSATAITGLAADLLRRGF
jgi:hypothetical protein